MYTNDCRLTWWNQNCDIPNRFRAPACQMNDDRQIVAELRQIFTFCSLTFWSYSTDLHQNFTRYRDISVAINPCIYKTMLHFVSKYQSREWRRSILTSVKRPQSLSITIATFFFNYRKNYFSFIICIHEPTNAKKLVMFGPVLAEILVWYVDFYRLVPKGTETPCVISGVSGPICTKIAQNVAKIVRFNNSKSELRYSNPLMPACWIKFILQILQILPKASCHGNVPKGIKKRSGSTKFTQILFICEKIVKISPVDPEIIWLKWRKKKLTQAKYIVWSTT